VNQPPEPDNATTAPRAGRTESDLRAAHRYGGGTVTLARLARAGASSSRFAWLHDISETGLGLDVLLPLSSGTDIVFEMRGSCEGERIRLHARVVHATRAGEFCRLGCRLTEPLPPALLSSILRKARAS
jgi:hypothetical protein